MEDGAPVLLRHGDDQVQTPDALARAVVEHFLPCGRIVEPSSGNGASLRALPEGADWYEIQDGRDFLKAEGRWDWAVGNPPFSQKEKGAKPLQSAFSSKAKQSKGVGPGMLNVG